MFKNCIFLREKIIDNLSSNFSISYISPQKCSFRPPCVILANLVCSLVQLESPSYATVLLVCSCTNIRLSKACCNIVDYQVVFSKHEQIQFPYKLRHIGSSLTKKIWPEYIWGWNQCFIFWQNFPKGWSKIREVNIFWKKSLDFAKKLCVCQVSCMFC